MKLKVWYRGKHNESPVEINGFVNPETRTIEIYLKEEEDETVSLMGYIPFEAIDRVDEIEEE